MLLLRNKRTGAAMEHLRNRYIYDHEEGCLRWQAYSEENGVSSMSRAKPGAIVGKRGFGEYQITRPGDRSSMSCGLRTVWQHVTGELVMGKIRTMNPRDTLFRIDNLYLVPFGQERVHKDRARNSVVVSYSYEREQYAVVDVDHSYNKQILSYHVDIDDAIKASNKPEVSFL